MSYNVKSIAVFEKQAKKLAKKYASFKDDLLSLVQDLKQNPEQGMKTSNNCYKIRLAIASKNKGKSSGARLITHFTIANNSVYLLSIYDKSEKENITDKELKELLNDIP